MAITYIHSVLLFDGIHFYHNSTVIFSAQTKTISSVTLGARIPPPKGATIVDGTGHTLLPGLIDGHIHVQSVLEGTAKIDPLEVLKSPLRCGVTTVCDMHSSPKDVKKLQAAEAHETENSKSGGGVTMANLKSCLYAATIEGGWPKPIVLAGHLTEEQIKEVKEDWPSVSQSSAVDFVRQTKANGADYIKLMQEDCRSLSFPPVPSASIELQTALVNAAHEEGMIAVGHAISLSSTELLLTAGIDGLTHTFCDQAPTKEIVTLYKEKNAFVIPTLTNLASMCGVEQELRDRFADIAERKSLLHPQLSNILRASMGLAKKTASVEYAYESVKLLKAAGIDIVAGTDAVTGIQGSALGPGLWMEMEMYASKVGMSTEEVLTSATSAGAKRFGFTDRGAVKVGMRADLVLVKGDVQQSLDAIWGGEKGEQEGIVAVWKQGVKAT
ncbi:hypothetical protein BT69DRAFT_1352024 [Atractiella rhizophila]|nr:hypothetical protein BT69DRAFT_1352024 [Atractiella rhizophila]